MKTVEEISLALEHALASEREAIRRLDAEAVERAAIAKEQALLHIRNAPAADRPALALMLTSLKGDLRRNLILLAHARDCMRGALESVRKNRLTAEL